eukprot:scaffold3.g6588.t1
MFEEAGQPFPTSAADPEEELNFLSPRFNALKALRAAGLRPPDPRARPLDNLYRCRALLPPGHPDALARGGPQRQPRSREAAEAAARAGMRREVVAARAERCAPRASPLDELAARVRGGPLLLLRRAYAARGRVRVVTRHARGVRGVAEGTLAAFDKYFNMVLRDVEEAYTVLLRNVERPAGGGGGRTRRAPKQEARQRKLRLAFLRGDSVVMVSLPPGSAAAAAAPTAAAVAAAGVALAAGAPAAPGGAADRS